MKGLLLDTCVISEQTRRQPSEQVRLWLDRQPPESLHLSVISIAEIRQGIQRLESSERSLDYTTWLDEDVLPAFAGRILPIDLDIAQYWGDIRGRGLREGRPLPLVDSMIAATAAVHGMSIVTRNVKDFEQYGVRIMNPWAVA